MSNREDGTYPGKISHAYVAEDQWEKNEYVLKLDVNIDGGGAVSCRQSLASGDKDKKAKRDSVLKELELPYPFRSSDLADLKDRTIDVNLKTSPKGRQNAYVSTQREERVLTAEEVDALATAGDDIPF